MTGEFLSSLRPLEGRQSAHDRALQASEPLCVFSIRHRLLIRVGWQLAFHPEQAGHPIRATGATTFVRIVSSTSSMLLLRPRGDHGGVWEGGEGLAADYKSRCRVMVYRRMEIKRRPITGRQQAWAAQRWLEVGDGLRKQEPVPGQLLFQHRRPLCLVLFVRSLLCLLRR